jgi:hypothetical protein
VATAPNQVWSWDITYLRSPVRGIFYYLYMIVDVFSRKVVGKVVHYTECQVCAAALIQAACDAEGVDPNNLTIHSDNGGPMKGATMVATMERLGVAQSFSRPRVSDDNPFSEALFRTVKYRPEYPSGPFATLDAARAWVDWFVGWYNHQHLHSAISFVTPAQRQRAKTARSSRTATAPISRPGPAILSDGLAAPGTGHGSASCDSTHRQLRQPRRSPDAHRSGGNYLDTYRCHRARSCVQGAMRAMRDCGPRSTL